VAKSGLVSADGRACRGRACRACTTRSGAPQRVCRTLGRNRPKTCSRSSRRRRSTSRSCCSHKRDGNRRARTRCRIHSPSQMPGRICFPLSAQRARRRQRSPVSRTSSSSSLHCGQPRKTPSQATAANHSTREAGYGLPYRIEKPGDVINRSHKTWPAGGGTWQSPVWGEPSRGLLEPDLEQFGIGARIGVQRSSIFQWGCGTRSPLRLEAPMTS
jgi:hypothetical protein